MPVVDEQGTLVGTLSATDARLLLTDPAKLADLHLPLKTMARFHQAPFDVAPITTKPSDTLAMCIVKLATRQPWGHIHRLWVVDDQGRPINVVSLRDIIARFVREPSADYFGSFFWV